MTNDFSNSAIFCAAESSEEYATLIMQKNHKLVLFPPIKLGKQNE